MILAFRDHRTHDESCRKSRDEGEVDQAVVGPEIPGGAAEGELVVVRGEGQFQMDPEPEQQHEWIYSRIFAQGDRLPRGSE